MKEKTQFLSLIKSNIDNYNYHITIVNSPTVPRYAYTIGLNDLFGFELIFAGGIYYMKKDLHEIFNAVFISLNKNKGQVLSNIAINSLGSFTLSKVHESWSELMMLGVSDYYKTKQFESFQIVPDKTYFTKDIPNMSDNWNAVAEPVWQWLKNKWDYPVPEDSTVVTDLKSLQGGIITEVLRCDSNEWEMFSENGHTQPKEKVRVVSFGTLLGIDETLNAATQLKVSEGIWRDKEELQWNEWI